MSNENEKDKGGLKNGTLLQNGKYKIIRYISQGGFGCTYEAVHTVFNERVAIKELFVKEYCNRDNETGMISVGVSSKQDMIERLHRKFIDEARAQRRMHHPNIVRVIDVFEENSTAYYVMDFIEGKSLEKMLVDRRGPLPESEAVGYIRMVADALAYVHSGRRLHLDVKPDNIMIDRNGKAVLIDFGASKQYDEQGKNESTLTGFTRGYAPIEQIGGHLSVFSPATDIFSLGSTLYRLLTGETPADSISRVNGMKLKPLPANVSGPTRRAVEKSMSVMLADRPQSISEFLDLLKGVPESAEQQAGGDSPETEHTERAFDSAAAGGSGNGNGNGGEPPTVSINDMNGPASGPFNPGAQSGGNFDPLTINNMDRPEKKGGSNSTRAYVLICLIIIVIGVSLFCFSQCDRSDAGGSSNTVPADSVTTYNNPDDPFVDLGLSKYWAKRNVIEADGCALLSMWDIRREVSELYGDSALTSYQLPSPDDWRELRDRCDWQWTPSPAGYRVVGPSGNWIFLPADGVETEEKNGEHVKYGGGEYACYWTSDSIELFTFKDRNVEFDKVSPGERYSARLVSVK